MVAINFVLIGILYIQIINSRCLTRTLDVKVKEVEEQIYGKEMIMQSGFIRHACNQIVNPFTLQYHFA